jgi:presenilin-like A22 family membrane protease
VQGEDVGVRNYSSTTVMFTMFVVAIVVAMAVSGVLPKEYRAFGEDVDDPTNPLWYIGLVICFTFFILYIARKGMQRLIQAIILFAVGMTMYFVLVPLIWQLTSVYIAQIVALQIAVILTYSLYKFPEWYVVDITGLLVAAGATAIFGISLGIFPAIILMSILAVYDAIAVYRTKHMVDLADSVMDLRLPILLVVPKERGYSFMEQASIKQEIAEGVEREAMFMGLGDIIIPGVLVVSSLTYLTSDVVGTADVLGIPGNVVVSISTLAGALCGFWILMWFVLKGRPQAGLPLLNSGAIVGYVVSTLLIFGKLGINFFGTII